jgi:hypothetical protein
MRSNSAPCDDDSRVSISETIKKVKRTLIQTATCLLVPVQDSNSSSAQSASFKNVHEIHEREHSKGLPSMRLVKIPTRPSSTFHVDDSLTLSVATNKNITCGLMQLDLE